MKTKRLNKIFIFSIGYAMLLYAPYIFAAPIPTLTDVLHNIGANVPMLMRLVTAFAYLMGTYLIIKGIIEMKHFGESRTMMSQEHGVKKPIVFILIGAALIFLPTSIQTGIATLWGTAVPYSYVVDTENPWSVLRGDIFLIIQFIGVIAFIRGLLLLTHLNSHGGQQSSFAKGLTHIIGGILCINMYDTIKMILATFGLDTSIIG